MHSVGSRPRLRKAMNRDEKAFSIVRSAVNPAATPHKEVRKCRLGRMLAKDGWCPLLLEHGCLLEKGKRNISEEKTLKHVKVTT